MTPPAIVVLFLALVLSSTDQAVEQSHDRAKDNVMNAIIKKHDLLYNNHLDLAKTETNNINDRTVDVNTNNDNNIKKNKVYDEIYTADVNDEARQNFRQHQLRVKRRNDMKGFVYDKEMRQYNSFNDRDRVKRVKRDDDDRCEKFEYTGIEKTYITHPHDDLRKKSYYNNSNCVTVIKGTGNSIIALTFVDVFHIEYHPECAYDYLEIRDGEYGYAEKLGRFCGPFFPTQVRSSGPYLWLKFHSDDTIEYEGFKIQIEIVPSPSSRIIPESCYITVTGDSGIVSSGGEKEQDCKDKSENQALDILWTIKVEEQHTIYLNFSSYMLAKPNECEQNFVQVFGSILEYESKLALYCGSMANAVTTKESKEGAKDGNIMYVRLFATKAAKTSSINMTFTAYKNLDPNNEQDTCDSEKEFDCEDNTCIAKHLKCNNYANCRLKTDENADLCKNETESVVKRPHILVILVIFSLILSGMCFVFLFKCISKLYRDQKIIKEHIRQSCEDRLDSLDSGMMLDAKRLQRISEPRASLERENHTNEYKNQRHFPHNQTSIDSDYIQETHLDHDDDSWRHEARPTQVEEEEVRIERNGRHRRSDFSRKEESIRKDSRATKINVEEERSKREIRDVSVGAPDTKESGCQTRESLFQAGISSPEGTESSSESRGFSTFGYSGATIARPTPPKTSHLTIELMKPKETPPKKIPDRRPMSSETTRSAPDVIIVSKPLR